MDVGPARNILAEQSPARKILLLVLFCLAQFLDTANISALFSAIPVIATSTGLSDSQSVWLNSAYQLSFAALLLMSGRMSDIYNPKMVFLSGVYLIGLLSLGIGFARDSVTILVLRALSGIGAALSIPSSLYLLVHTFPDPVVQAKAVAGFAGAGALGNVLGIIIGALVISYSTWPWVFYSSAILALHVAVACTFLIPPVRPPLNNYTLLEQFRRLDIIGGSVLIAALVLFIFAVTSGSIDGWKAATVIIPLFLSALLFVLFFVWEARIPEEHASLPPRLWLYPNFASLAILALLPYSWWSIVYLMFGWYWQEVQSWSAIASGVRFLPIGIFSALFMSLSSELQRKFAAKYILLGGLFLMAAGTVFLPLANNADRYWPIVFPGFLLGTAGTSIVFATANIAVFAATPPELAGTVGAVFNCALQLGVAVFSAAATSVQTSVQSSPTSFKGRAAAFEFLIAFIVLQIVSVLFFVRRTASPSVQSEGSSTQLTKLERTPQESK